MRFVGITVCVMLLVLISIGEFQRSARPVSLGNFTEMQYSGTVFRDNGDDTYSPPKNIGTTYPIQVRGIYGYGLPSSRIWRGLEASSDSPRPAIVLLHGAGRDGRSMLDMWQSVAKAADLNLIAPDASGRGGWSYANDGENFVSAVLKSAMEQYNIDPDQIYLFGHSAGGVMAQHITNSSNGPWRVVATHAGFVSADDVRSNPAARPFYMYLGDKDRRFSIPAARATAAALAGAGHEVKLIVIPNHTHWFYKAGPAIAAQIWEEIRVD